MLNHFRRRPLPPPPSPAAVVDDGYLACYGIVVACASLLLLTVLAATVSIGRACALAGAVGAAFGLVGCLARWRRAAVVGAPAPADGTGMMMRPPRGAAVAVDVLPPAFAYARPATDAAEGGSGKAGRRAACPVCLEGVQDGETVRRLPACEHLFHAECIDAWLLRSRSTCPLCRRDVWAPQQPSDAKPARPEADPPDNNALPPV